MFEKQLEYMTTPEPNSFLHDEIEMEEAYPEKLILDEDRIGGEDIDILQCNN